jgi:hypothetical protein
MSVPWPKAVVSGPTQGSAVPRVGSPWTPSRPGALWREDLHRHPES